MPDRRLTQLPVLAALSADDIFYVVDDPAGAANSRQVAASVFDARYLQAANNLSDLTNVVVARASLGLGTLAVINSPLPIINGGSGQVTQQAAIDALTNVAAATNEHVLTKDTATGNAIFKVSATVLPVADTTAIVKGSVTDTKQLRFEVDGFTAATTRVITPPNADITLAGQNYANVFTAAQDVSFTPAGGGTFGLAVTLIHTQDLILQALRFNNIARNNGLAAGFSGGYGVNGTVSVEALTANSYLRTIYGGIFKTSFTANGGFTASSINGGIAILADAPGISGAGTITPGKFVGLQVANQGTNKVASSYGLKIEAQSGSTANNYSIYTDGGLNRLGDRITITQPSATGAAPTLQLTQIDVSEEFVRFIGTSANGVLTQSIVENADVGAATLQGWLKVFVQDDGNQLADQAYFVPIYTLA